MDHEAQDVTHVKANRWLIPFNLEELSGDAALKDSFNKRGPKCSIYKIQTHQKMITDTQHDERGDDPVLLD